jgi:hypothetical protein
MNRSPRFYPDDVFMPPIKVRFPCAKDHKANIFFDEYQLEESEQILSSLPYYPTVTFSSTTYPSTNLSTSSAGKHHATFLLKAYN